MIVVMRSAWVVVGLGVALTTLLPPGWCPALTVCAAYYAYTRCVQVFYDYAAIRYSRDSRGIVVVRGLFGRDEQRFSWQSVVTVSATQSLLQRVLRVTDVRLDLDASEIASATIPGVSVEEASRLVSLHARNRVPPPNPAAAARPAPGASAPHPAPSRAITPVLSVVDFLLIGVYSGTFVFFVPSVYSTVHEVGAWIGSSSLLPPLQDLSSLGTAMLSAIIWVTAVLSVGYGACVAWLRYRRYSVVLDPNGRLVFSAGLSSSEQRVIAVDAVAAYELRRPVLMRPVHRGFLRAVVRGGGGHVTRGKLLPLIRVSDGVHALSALTSLPGAALDSPVRLSKSLIAMCAVVGIGLGSAAIAVFSRVEVALVIASIAFLLYRVVDERVGSIRVVSAAPTLRWIVAQRGILFRSTWVISAGAVDVSRWSGVSRRLGSQTVSLRGRRLVRIAVWPSSARRALQFRRAVDSSTAVVFERNTR